jgi:hypothetical protein
MFLHHLLVLTWRTVMVTVMEMYEVVSESSQAVIVLTALVKENAWGGQDHTLQTRCISLPCDTVTWTHIVFTWLVFWLRFILSAMDDKNRATYVCERFEVFTAVTMKNGVFWDVTPCGSCKNL